MRGRRLFAAAPPLKHQAMPMNPQGLIVTTQTIAADDRSLPAMDEINGTSYKRFAGGGIYQTVEMPSASPRPPGQ